MKIEILRENYDLVSFLRDMLGGKITISKEVSRKKYQIEMNRKNNGYIQKPEGMTL